MMMYQKTIVGVPLKSSPELCHCKVGNFHSFSPLFFIFRTIMSQMFLVWLVSLEITWPLQFVTASKLTKFQTNAAYCTLQSALSLAAQANCHSNFIKICAVVNKSNGELVFSTLLLEIFSRHQGLKHFEILMWDLSL